MARKKKSPKKTKKKSTFKLINFKVNMSEHAKLAAKARRYTRGNVSELLRRAGLKYAA